MAAAGSNAYLLAGGPSPVVECRDIAGVSLSVIDATARDLDFVANNVKRAPTRLSLIINRQRANVSEEPLFDRADLCECCLSFPQRRTIGPATHRWEA